ncbi:MAG: glycosyltransferase family 39 protein [Patescibacteria group bacterium]|jgi:hypothetical protein
MFAAGIITVLSLTSYISSVLLTYFEKEFILRWVAFGLSLVPVILTGFWMFLKLVRGKISPLFLRSFYTRDVLLSIGLLIIVLSVAATLRFLFLGSYPFVSVGDEVRDGGLHAFEIATGLRTEIFSYGVYESHGLIIATAVSFLYRIFQHSVYSFRVAAALVGIADVFILYVFLHKSLNKWTAFFAALILACLPIHLFYSRTEIVVIFSSFWTTVILLSMYLMITKKTTAFIIWAGTILGFVAGFHTSARTVVFGACLILITFLGSWLTHALIAHKRRAIRLLQCAGFIFFFFAGFGPRILYSPVHIFFQSRSLNVHSSQVRPGENWIQQVTDISISLKDTYIDSFLVYLQNPTLSHYPDHRPILPPLLALFFLIGLTVAVLILNGKIWKIVAFLTLLIPFTNSAMTEAVNNDHRLAPMFVFASILSGIGVWFVVFRSKGLRFVQWLLGAVIVLYIMLHGVMFFGDQPASKDRYVRDYLGMHLIYQLQQQPKMYQDNHICLRVNPGMAEYLNFIHVREQFNYFIPKLYYDVAASDTAVKPNELYVMADCAKDLGLYQTFRISCNSAFDFRCPITEPQYKEFILHVARY